jgi:aminoglycoside phosphotransferase (APT) family kinase protein
MKSISKTAVSKDVAAAIAVDAFGDVELVQFDELTDGWFNAAYALSLSDGRRVVLKVAPPPDVEVLTYERDILRAEVEALRLVRAHTSAPVPGVLWFDESCKRVRSPLFVMPFVPGDSLHKVRDRLDDSQQAAIDSELGRHLRAINDIRGTAFGLLSPSAARYDTWRGAFTALWTALLGDGERKSVALPVTYDEIRAAFELAAPACDEVTEPCFVCWDLWDGNVLVDAADGTLRGILDLERALWGDPLMETQFGPEEFRDATLAAYGPTALDTTGGRIRRAAYTLYVHLVMSIEGAYRQYPDDFIGDYARGQLTADLGHLTQLVG